MDKKIYSIIKKCFDINGFNCNIAIILIENDIFNYTNKDIDELIDKQFIKNYNKLLRNKTLSDDELKKLDAIAVLNDIIEHKKRTLLNRGMSISDYCVLNKAVNDLIYEYLRNLKASIREEYLRLKKDYNESVKYRNEIVETFNNEKKSLFLLDDFSDIYLELKKIIEKKLNFKELDRLCTTEKEKDALNIIKNQKDKIVEDIIKKSLYKVSGEKLYNYYNFYRGYVGESYFLDIIREKKDKYRTSTDILNILFKVSPNIAFSEIINKYYMELKKIIETDGREINSTIDDCEILSENNMSKIIDLISDGIINSDEVLKVFDKFIPEIEDYSSHNYSYLKMIGLEDLYDNPDAYGYLGSPEYKIKK